MSLRLILLMQIAVLLSSAVLSVDAVLKQKRSDNGTADLQLVVGKEVLIPEVEEESDKENAKEANKEPTTDVIPGKDSKDKQEHDEKERKGKNIENGMPPKYPLKAESAETSAHDNEIGGCRDHPRAGLVCSKCENGNKCFPAEHESYTYSYCRRSCRHCDPSTSSFHTFWRLRALSEFEPTWMLQQVEFYADPQEKISLVDDPEKAYASSVYTGYKPSFAFDNTNSTAWYPSGWGNHDNNDDWIAYEFTVAVRVHGVRMVVDKDHATAQPKKVVVEASDKMYGPFQKKWTIYNNDYSVDKVYKLLECDVLWRRFEVEDGAWCFRLIAKLETWEGARKACEIEGGDLATISNKEEQRFVTDEVGLCSHTWFGLSHTNQGYFWNDGSNSTFRNWKDQLTYSDVQKQTLNCAAMDPDGVWYNFHCSNKFYFVCKKRLVPRAEPRPDLTDNAWPYPPEVPPLIFFAPNVTVPVINSKNLEPGVFPDANGKVEGQDEEEDITLSDLFYEQTVEHLKEKGLKPSEEIEADENQEETDFTQELNKIAINTSPGDFQNETKGDQSANNTATAHKQEQDFENIPNKEANNAVTNAASADSPKPKPKHKEKPVPPPPEDGEDGSDTSYPEIKHGKPVDDDGKDDKNKDKKLPKGSPGPKDKSSMLGPLPVPEEAAEAGHEAAHKAETIGKQDEAKGDKKRKKKPVHRNEEENDQGKQGQQAGQQTSAAAAPPSNNTSNNNSTASVQPPGGMYFYVPNGNGGFTLMKTITPFNMNMTPPNMFNNQGQQPMNPQNLDPSKMTFMNLMPGQGGGNMMFNMPNNVPKPEAAAPETPPETPQKAENIEKKEEEKEEKKEEETEEEKKDEKEGGGKTEDAAEKPATPAAPASPPGVPPAAAAPGAVSGALPNGTAPQVGQGMYFYVPNPNGTMTLMRTIYPWNGQSFAPQPSASPAAAAAAKPPTPPPPKEGDDDDDSEDSVEEPPEVKQDKKAENLDPSKMPFMNLLPGQGNNMPIMFNMPSNMSPSNMPSTMPAAPGTAPDTLHKAENIEKKNEGDEQKDKTEAKEGAADKPPAAPAAPVVPQMAQAALPNGTAPKVGQGMYFYLPNSNGTMTLMRTLYPWNGQSFAPPQPGQPAAAAAAAPAATTATTAAAAAALTPPAAKEEGDDDDDGEGSAEPAAVKQDKKAESFKNKEIPMSPFVGPLSGPSLAHTNISKAGRKKIKVLQPLESAAQGDDSSVMNEKNKLNKKKVLSRTMIHQPKKILNKKRKRNRHLNHVKAHDSLTKSAPKCCTGTTRNQCPAGTKCPATPPARKSKTHEAEAEEEEEEQEEEVADESGSGSGGVQRETDTADIFPETDFLSDSEEFWSK